jgi:hypothetical protein
MDLVFNELSVNPLSVGEGENHLRIFGFLKAYKVFRASGFGRVRFYQPFQDIQLSEGVTVQDWLNSTTDHTLKSLLLSLYRYPFIDDNDEEAVEKYISNTYYFEDAEYDIARVDCPGLAAAHIYNTLAISFSSSLLWARRVIQIQCVPNNGEDILSYGVLNISSELDTDAPEISAFIEGQKDIELVETTIKPGEKRISLRDDHGKDILKSFSERLIMSPYVEEIINSMPFNPKLKRFIKKIRPDGIIEIVLFWDDRGIGIVVKTTGRNLRETHQIAKSLKEEFSQ